MSLGLRFDARAILAACERLISGSATATDVATSASEVSASTPMVRMASRFQVALEIATVLGPTAAGCGAGRGALSACRRGNGPRLGSDRLAALASNVFAL